MSGLLFGLAPALATVRVDLNSALKTGGAPVLGVHFPAARVLLGLQVMLTVVLVSASGLMIRTYWNLLHAQPGFDVNHVVSFRIDPAAAGLQGQQLAAFYRRLEEKARSLPLVQGAGLVSRVLMRGKGLGTTIVPTGKTLPPGTFLNTSVNVVSPGYFDAMGMRLIEGRNLRFSDGDGAKPGFAVVVDEAFAHAFFPGQDVIGRTFAIGTDGRVPPNDRIVGLVSSAKYRSLREVPPPTFYGLPYWASSSTGMLNLNVRVRGDPVSVIPEVRQAIKEMNSRVPIVEVTTMKQEVRNSLWQERLLLLMTVFFGVAGLLLASIGLYGALTQAVAQSKRDIGIRMALGARVRHIIEAIGWPQFITVGVAAVCGFAVSAFALRLAGPFLYKVSVSIRSPMGSRLYLSQ